MELAPIVIFVYNRPWHTAQTIEALKENTLASQSDLFIFSDGAKNPQAEEMVNQVRQYIDTISGFKSITIIKRAENYGLARNIREGVTQIINTYNKIIVLEDDLLCAKFFFCVYERCLRKIQRQ